MRKIISIFMTAVLLCSFAFSAFAEDVVQCRIPFALTAPGLPLR